MLALFIFLGVFGLTVLYSLSMCKAARWADEVKNLISYQLTNDFFLYFSPTKELLGLCSGSSFLYTKRSTALRVELKCCGSYYYFFFFSGTAITSFLI